MRAIDRDRFGGGIRRLMLLAAALALLALTAAAVHQPALAQQPPDDDPPELINADQEFVERKKDGGFTARPVFDRQLAVLYYGVRNADTGDWITGLYRVIGGERRQGEGWERSFAYPALDGQPELDPERAYLLAMLARETSESAPQTFYAVIPVHRPTGLWDRVLGALDPGLWARAFARWVIEGVHGTLCGVVERASGADAANCRSGA